MKKRIRNIITALLMLFAANININAEPIPDTIKNRDENIRLDREIQALSKQAEQMRSLLKQDKTQNNDLKEQLRLIEQKIKTAREKLMQLRKELRQERLDNHKQEQDGQGAQENNLVF